MEFLELGKRRLRAIGLVARDGAAWMAGFFALSIALSLVTPKRGDPAPVRAEPPIAPVREVVENYFGTKVSDPYRYMENLESPTVQAWLKNQSSYARAILGAIPGREGLLSRLRELDESAPARIGGLRRLPSGRLFYLKASSKDAVFRLAMRDGIAGPEKLLVNPEKMAGAGGETYAIDYYTPSDDGRWVAYGVSPGGSGETVLHVLDTTTGRDTGEPIDRALFGDPIAWRPEGRSFFYNRLRKPAAGAAPEERYLQNRVYLHIVGTAPAKDIPVFGFGVSPLVSVNPLDISLVVTAPLSPWALGIVQHGVLNELSIYVAPVDSLGRPGTPWRPVCNIEDEVTRATVRGDDLYLLTHKHASRFKVIHTRASNPDVAHADTVLAAGEEVVTDLGAAQDALYVRIRGGARDRLLSIPYAAGAKPERIALPGDGSLWPVPSDPRVSGIAFTLTGWTRAPQLLNWDPATKAITDMQLLVPGPYDVPRNIESEEVTARSADGTGVPLSIIYPRGLKLDGSHPTLLHGYGAYGISMDPYFDPKSLAWLERGGVYAVAHVRGGGEYGEDWHRAGQKLTKPNSWRDFIACARYLVQKNYTSPSHLAAAGRSAGGALIGRVLTEQPDLFAAGIIEAGDTDSLRTEFMESGPANIPEFGTVKEPDGFRALYEMSAYQHVKDGANYPAVLLLTGINDHNVAPWQPAKMAARLQAASASGRPVLLRVDYQAGHAMGSTRRQGQEEMADKWAFLFWQLGLPAFQPR